MCSARKTSKITKLLAPVLPIVLMTMGCAADVEPQPDQSSADITGKDAADKLGHAELVRSGIPSKTPIAKMHEINTWDVYVLDHPRADGPENIKGVVAFGIGEDSQVRYAIVITSDQKEAAVMKYDSDAVIARFNDGTVDPSRSISREEFPSDLAEALDEERVAIQAELENMGDGVACAGAVALALAASTIVGGFLWLAGSAAVAGAWDLIICGLLPTTLVPAAAVGVVVSVADTIEHDCGGLLNRW